MCCFDDLLVESLLGGAISSLGVEGGLPEGRIEWGVLLESMQGALQAETRFLLQFLPLEEVILVNLFQDLLIHWVLHQFYQHLNELTCSLITVER